MDPEKPGTDDELPSWVPKFNQKLRTERIYRRDFAASGKGVEHKTQIPGNRSSLNLNGLHFDTVAEVEVKASHHQPYFSSFRPNLNSWLGILSRLHEDYPDNSGITRLRLLDRTLTADLGSSEGELSYDDADILWNMVAIHMSKEPMSSEERGSLLQQMTSVTTAKVQDLIPNIEKGLEVQGSFINQKDFRRRILLYHYRSLLRSTLGYLGLGPMNAQPGDQIWLVAGARTPFILRPVSRSSNPGPPTFNFIGETYVHGIMYGEAVDGKNAQFMPISLV
jgi:hypothetical protein